MTWFVPILTQAFTAFVVNTVLSAFITIRGPKIGDIAVQTSQEGVPRPIVFGLSPPIAGNIIATSDPIKVTKSKRTGFLGLGPKVKTEHVYRTYAIAICEGPIAGVVRVWRNGKLVFGADAEVTTWDVVKEYLENKTAGPTGQLKMLSRKMRFYRGDYDQLPDPALEAIFGVGNVPAHRGTAYMVIDNEELTDLGGAIPQWAFQVSNTPTDNILLYTEDGTWTKPAGLDHVEVLAVGGGGGGASGNRRASGENGAGGGGGGGGGRSEDNYDAENLPDTVAVTVGDGGSGGTLPAAQADANPAPGSAGGSSSFGSLLVAGGGSGGQGGPVSGGVLGGAGGTGTTQNGGNGAAGGSVAAGANAADITLAPGGGGGGGGHQGTNGSPRSGGSGGDGSTSTVLSTGGLGGSTTSGNDGANGQNGSAEGECGGGGGGGRSGGGGEHPGLDPAHGGNGGHGIRGSGGGGGGSAIYGHPSGPAKPGDGGTGGSGFVLVKQFFTGDLPLAELVRQICNRAGLQDDQIDVSELSGTVKGFVVTNAYAAYEALGSVARAYFFDPSNYDGKIHFIPRGGNSVATITEADMVDDGGEIEEERRQDAISIPRVLHLSYHDVDGGLNPDKQSSERAGDRRSTGEVVVQSPVVMDATTAARVIDKAHKVMIEDQKGELKFSLPDNWLRLVVGDPVIVQWQGRSERCRISRCELLEGYQNYTLLRDRQSAYTSNVEGIPAAPVTPVAPTNPGGTLLEVLDIPPITSEDAERVGVYLAMSGILPAWQGALVELSFDGGQNYVDSADWNLSTIMGETLTVLADHPVAYPDTVNTVRVRIDTPDAALNETDLAGLMNRQNLAIIGNELIQFAEAQEVDEGEWELSYFLRGRRHSQTESHPIGSRFVLLDDSMPFVPIDIAYLNQTVTVRATSYGYLPEAGTVASFTFTAATQKEFPVGYLSAHMEGSDAVITWQGAGRVGSGVNASHGTKFSGYRVTISDGSITETVDTDEQHLTHDVSAFSAPITIRVQQRNQLTGLGPYTEVTLP